MEASASRLARLSTDDERLARALEESRISDAPGQPRGPPPTISPADAEAIQRVLDADEVKAELSRLRSGPRARPAAANDMANWYLSLIHI